jgi:amphiphysin
MEPLLFSCANTGYLQLLQKTGQIERTVDQDFASEEAKYRVYVPPFLPSGPSRANPRNMSRFEKECGTLQKDGKSYLDAMRGALASLTLLPLATHAWLTTSPRA